MPQDTIPVVSGGTIIKTRQPAGAWADFAGIISVAGPDMSRGKVETTQINPYVGASTTPAVFDLYKTFVAGWIETGEMSFECHYTSQQYATAFALFGAGTAFLVRVDFRNGYSFLSNAFISGLGFAVAAGDETVKAPVTLTLSGKPQFTDVTTAAAATYPI